MPPVLPAIGSQSASEAPGTPVFTPSRRAQKGGKSPRGRGAIGLAERCRRLLRNSECRTPLIVQADGGDPSHCVAELATELGSPLVEGRLDSPEAAEEAVRAVRDATNSGAWVLLHGNDGEDAGGGRDAAQRAIARLLVALSPDPEQHPLRGRFRLWLSVAQDIDFDTSMNPVFPLLLRQNALYVTGQPQSPRGCRLKTLAPAEPALKERARAQRAYRAACGRDADSESDTEDADLRPIRTGLWFQRCVEYYRAENERPPERSTAYRDQVCDGVLRTTWDAWQRKAPRGRGRLLPAAGQ